jgi:hypothetical protein
VRGREGIWHVYFGVEHGGGVVLREKKRSMNMSRPVVFVDIRHE